MSADPAGARRAATTAGGALFPQQGSPGAVVAGRFSQPPQRALRDQHGGSGGGQWGSMSTCVVLLAATLPHTVCGRSFVRHSPGSSNAHHSLGTGSQELRR